MSGGEDWTMFRELVLTYNDVPDRAAILRITDSSASVNEKERQIRALGRTTWNYLTRYIFPAIRRADISVSWNSLPPLSESVTFENDMSADVSVMPRDSVATEYPATLPEVSEPALSAVAEWNRHYYIKTNLLGWPCLWANLEGEADFARHWSAALAVYYSGWNYFRRITKFRTFTVMPEVRYWPKASGGANDGLFIGAHFGMCYYNVALSGDNRYQDHNGTTPALGGGITLGWRLPLRNPRWKMEFSAGAGIYHLDYDIFENRTNGLLTGRRKRTFYGLDKVAVSLCYTFGPVSNNESSGHRKGGDR